MHGSLYCSAFTAYLFDGTAESAYCTASCCQQQPETLTHLFMECPSVRPAVDWLLDMWQCIGGVRPPRDALVLLADDHRVWTPALEQHRGLWTLLRLEFLYAVWSSRCRRSTGGSEVQPAGVAAVVVAKMRRHIELDWLRTSSDVRRLSSACSSWFRGRESGLEVVDFLARWGPPGVLCVVTGADPGVMKVTLTTSSPLPLPVPLAPLPVLPDALD